MMSTSQRENYREWTKKLSKRGHVEENSLSVHSPDSTKFYTGRLRPEAWPLTLLYIACEPQTYFWSSFLSLGSISAVSQVPSLILPEERLFLALSGGWMRAHFPEQRLVIEPIFSLRRMKLEPKKTDVLAGYFIYHIWQNRCPMRIKLNARLAIRQRADLFRAEASNKSAVVRPFAVLPGYIKFCSNPYFNWRLALASLH